MVMLPLYGVSVLQTYIYYHKYTGDQIEIKALVAALFVLGTVHAIFVCHTVYHYVVLSYINPALLIDGEWSVYAATGLTVIICFLVQGFYARMIYHLSRGVWRLILAAIFGVLIALQLAFGIALIILLRVYFPCVVFE